MTKGVSNSKIWLGLVEHILLKAGYSEYDGAKSELARDPELVDNAVYTREAIIGPSLFGTPYQTSFFLADRHKFPLGLAIQVNYQGGPGSTDRKFPFIVESLALSSSPAILLAGGQGLTEPCSEYLRSCARNSERLRVFFHVDDIIPVVSGGLY